MTEARILELAWDQAIEVWGRWYDKLKKNPDNEIYQYRENKARKEVKEIENIIHVKRLTSQI